VSDDELLPGAHPTRLAAANDTRVRPRTVARVSKSIRDRVPRACRQHSPVAAQHCTALKRRPVHRTRHCYQALRVRRQPSTCVRPWPTGQCQARMRRTWELPVRQRELFRPSSTAARTLRSEQRRGQALPGWRVSFGGASECAHGARKRARPQWAGIVKAFGSIATLFVVFCVL